MPTKQPSVNLLNLFQAAATTLSQHQQTLNQADTYNHDHGDNMTQIFNLITQAVAAKKTAPPASQLSYASQVVRQNATSGSAKLYADNLQRAATQVQGKKSIDPQTAMMLIQLLMGVGQAVAAAKQTQTAQKAQVRPQTSANRPRTVPTQNNADLLSTLLTGMAQSQQQPTPSTGNTDLLGSLLSNLSGTQTSTQQPAASQTGDAGLDLGDILNAGMAYMQSKQSGESTMQAVTEALLAGSAMNQSQDRAMSSRLVTNSLLQALSSVVSSGAATRQR